MVHGTTESIIRGVLQGGCRPVSSVIARRSQALGRITREAPGIAHGAQLANARLSSPVMEIPEAERPSLSGYVQAGKLLPWRWVDARMQAARNYWISTAGAGFPNSRPVWGIWKSPILWFSTGGSIARRVASDSRVQVNLESADELVIIEGHAAPLAEEDAAEWASEYNQKYNWDMPESTQGVYRVEPQRVLAWIVDPTGLDGGVMFSNSATQWRFPASSTVGADSD